MPFQICALEVVPRLLGLMDRRPDGDTAGCFDRGYWRYRLTDFPSAWFQNATEMLAWLATVQPAPWTGTTLRTWTEAAIAFSLRLVAADGSVAEAYPNERGFCATAFLACHLGASIGLLDMPPDARLVRMAGFLATNAERRVPANQLAAAALALFRIGRIEGNAALTAAGRHLLDRLATEQHPGGGFWEYGPGDVGYQSITLSLLAQMADEGHPLPPDTTITRALAFVETLISPDGSYDYLATSRHTQYMFPFGLLYFGSSAVDALRRGLLEDRIIRPAWLDDRYAGDLAIDHFRAWQALLCE